MEKRDKNVSYLRFVITYNIVLLIPLLLVSFSVFYMVHRQHYKKIMDETVVSAERQADYFKQQMAVISAFNADCRYSKIYNRQYSEKPPVSYLEMAEDLKKKESTFPFVDSMYYYICDGENKIISSGGTLTEELFFSRICRLDRNLFSRMEDRVLYAVKAELYGGSSTGIVIICPLVTWVEKGKSDTQYLLYVIRDSKLMEQFGGTGLPYEDITLISFQDQLLFSSRKGDNRVLLEGGRGWETLLDGEEYYTNVTDMESGFSAMTFVSKAEISRSAVSYFKGYGIWILCSVFVGLFLAFYYSRKKYQSFRSLLDNNEMLEEERNLLRAENCLYELLTKEVIPGDELWERCLRSSIHINRRHLFFAVFPQIEENRELYQLFGSQMNDYSASTAYRVVLFEEIYVYLVCSDESIGEITRRLEKLSGNGVKLGVGRITTDVSKIRLSYEEARKELRREQHQEQQFPEQELKALKEAAGLSDSVRTIILLTELKDIASEVKESMALCIAWEVMHILNREPGEFFSGKENAELSKEGMDRFFERMIGEQAALSREEEGNGSDAFQGNYRKKNIADILDYIHAHYLDDNFTVKYMAAYFDTSVSNLSHFFKKNMQVSISQYVDKIKLDRAKELLADSDKKISEIAQLLRYGNSTVFIEMFKKYEGITPGGYRENIWRSRM